MAVAAEAGVLANDVAATADAIFIDLVSGPAHGFLSLNADGSFSYVHNVGFNGTDSFTYLSENGGGGSTPATVTIAVDNVAPTAALSGSTGTEQDDQDQQFGWEVSDVASDLDSVEVTVTKNGLPIGSLSGIVGANGSVDFNELGVVLFEITLTATDKDGSVTVVSRAVQVVDEDTETPVITLGGSSGSGLEIDTNYNLGWVG